MGRHGVSHRVCDLLDEATGHFAFGVLLSRCADRGRGLLHAGSCKGQTDHQDGTFKEEEQAQALSRAISVAIKSLSKDALDYIKEISGGDTVGYLTTRIQAQISRNKGVSK